MTGNAMTDRMWNRITRTLIDTGRPPHHAELARSLGVSPSESRTLNGLPTQYRVTVRGEQKWFAQCGVEATSVTWLFPGERVRIDAACLDCGDPLAVEMLDGRLTWVDAPTVIGHLNYGFGPSRGRPPFV
jgi:hypothetical protein